MPGVVNKTQLKAQKLLLDCFILFICLSYLLYLLQDCFSFSENMLISSLTVIIWQYIECSLCLSAHLLNHMAHVEMAILYSKYNQQIVLHITCSRVMCWRFFADLRAVNCYAYYQTKESQECVIRRYFSTRLQHVYVCSIFFDAEEFLAMQSPTKKISYTPAINCEMHVAHW